MKKGYFPYWMREPLPEEDRVKYISREEVIRRLNYGETIFFIPDTWMRVAPRIYFEKDTRLKAIKRQTFESLRNKGVIKWKNPTMYNENKREIWILSALSSLKDKSIDEVEEIPQMKGTRDALDGLTLKEKSK